MARVLKPGGKLILLSDQWDCVRGISAELYDLQERCFDIFQHRRGYTTQPPPKTKPTLRRLYNRFQNLVASKEQRQYNLTKEGIISFLDHNGLNNFYERVWASAHTEEMTLEPEQIRQEFASQIYVSNLTPQEQKELHEYLDARLTRHMDSEGFIPCRRACFSVVGTLAR